MALFGSSSPLTALSFSKASVGTRPQQHVTRQHMNLYESFICSKTFLRVRRANFPMKHMNCFRTGNGLTFRLLDVVHTRLSSNPEVWNNLFSLYPRRINRPLHTVHLSKSPRLNSNIQPKRQMRNRFQLAVRKDKEDKYYSPGPT